MFRIILWTIIIYFVFKFIGRIFRYLTGQFSQQNQNLNGNARYNEPKFHNNGNETNKTHYKIDEKDIVDAHFEEIKPDENKSTKDE